MVLSIYIFYQVLALSHTGQAAISTAPVEPLLSAANGNRTILNTQISPSWVSNAGLRDTSDILWSCILTLAACVYTAIHLNVPPPHEGRWQFLWRKSKWVALALFAPEIVLYCAFTQLRKARGLVKKLNELRAPHQASPDRLERHESALASPDAPKTNSKDDFNVTEQEPRVSITQQDQAPSEISPLPLPNDSAPKHEDTAINDDTVPISEYDAGGQTSHHASQKSISTSNKRNADGEFRSKGPDL